MALSLVQHKSAIRGLAIPASIVLSGTPSVGNLILLFLHTNITTSGVTVDTTKWTVGATVLGGAGNNTTYGQLLYRYVQGGDTSTLPAQWTAGSTYNAYDVYEISGVTGTFATDVPLIATASSLTTTNLLSLQPAALTSTVANAIGIIGGGRYNGTANPTVNASYVADETQNNNSNYGATASSHLAMAATGSNGQPTFTLASAGAGPMDVISVIVQLPGASTETGTVTMSFGPIGMNAAGSAAKGGGTTLAFGPAKFNAGATDKRNATAIMAFGPIAMVVNALDIAGSKLRQFWTR
jgi:hypothetical protein